MAGVRMKRFLSSVDPRMTLIVGLVGVLAAGSAAAMEPLSVEGTVNPAGKSILKQAFDNRYDCDLSAEIELRMQSRSGAERRRVVRAIVKRIGGRLYSIGRLVSPPYLRGMTIMSIENRDRADDSFVYLPSLHKVRRITTAQKTDSFLGSDLTFEDLERHRLLDYEVSSVSRQAVKNEEGFLVRARPTHRLTYEYVEFDIARSDWAILEIRYFRSNEASPERVIQAPRGSMTTVGNHVLPTQLTVQNRARGTTTQVFIRDLQVNPEIDDREFSVGSLQKGPRSRGTASEPGTSSGWQEPVK
jgi:hypothetical protein